MSGTGGSTWGRGGEDVVEQSLLVLGDAVVGSHGPPGGCGGGDFGQDFDALVGRQAEVGSGLEERVAFLGARRGAADRGDSGLVRVRVRVDVEGRREFPATGGVEKTVVAEVVVS